MRVTSGHIYDNSKRNIQGNFAEMVKWQNQLSSGKRVTKLSDDAAQSGLLLRQRSLKNAISQYDSNLRIAKDYVGNSETQLTEMQGILRKGYELAVQGANSTVDQPARLALADQVVQMQRRLVDLANGKGNDGQYLFAGQLTDTQPYTASGNTITYSGDANGVRVETSPGQTMKVNTAGGQDFINAYNQLESLRVNLIGGQPGVISGMNVDALKAQTERFSQLRSEAGIAMQQVKDLESMNARRMDELTEGISAIEDVDFADAVTELSRAQTAYQASLQVASNSFNLSLMDYLR